jgi:hypothetical protein
MAQLLVQETDDLSSYWSSSDDIWHADTLSSMPCRYTVDETADLLRDVGFQDVATLRTHGVNGGDLLELTDQEMKEELHLSHLQVCGSWFLSMLYLLSRNTFSSCLVFTLRLPPASARSPILLACMQAKKVRNLQSAFTAFNIMMRRPGSGEVTFLELKVCTCSLEVLHGRPLCPVHPSACACLL